MRVKLATQIFNSQVATALNVYASIKLLPEIILSTAFFIKNMDILFDILISCKLKADKPTRSALTLNSKFIQQLEDLRCCINLLVEIRSRGGIFVVLTAKKVYPAIGV